MFSLPWELEFGMNKLVFGKKNFIYFVTQKFEVESVNSELLDPSVFSVFI
jgi:hypothetical protein